MDNPVFELFLALGIIIAASKFAGALARRFGQPRVFGELLMGVLLGPTVIDLLHLPVFTDEHIHDIEVGLEELAELGVLFLMFNIGLEVHLGELVKVGRVAVLAGILGAVVPVALAFGAMQPFDFSQEVMLFVGVTLAATSVSISAQTLLELGLLRTKEGFALLATALVDDVVAILLLSFVVATTGSGAEGGEAGGLAFILLQITGFIVIGGLIAWFVVPRVIALVDKRSQIQGTAATGLVMALIFGWAAETLGGVAAITGAFIVGVGISQAPSEAKHKIEQAVTYITYAFLVPVFFVNVGLSTNLRLVTVDDFPLAIVLIAVAVISKVGGAGLGARFGGFDNGESFRLGVAMISRGEVGLIIAAIGLNAGVFDEHLFPTLFLVILLTTVITPPFVRQVFRDQVKAANAESPVTTQA